MSILSSFLGYKAAKNETKAATQAGQLAADAANTGVAENARQFDITRSYYDPIYNDSRAAASLYNTALGIQPTTTTPTAPGPTMTGGGVDYRAYVEGSPDLKAEFGRVAAQFNGDEAAYGRYHWDTFGKNEPGRQLPSMTGGTASTPAAPATPTAPSLTRDGVISMVNNTPGYQAQVSEGIKAVDRAAPLRGGMYSGRRMKALDDYGQQTFGSYYQNWLDRVGGVAGTGTGAASGVSNAGQAATTSSNNLRMTGASAQGNAKLNAANTWSGFLGDTAGSIQNFGRNLMTMGG
jgi:hypothetical protein